jgi:Cytochrome c7 and related cytochrome c/Cytochrome c554 and c-prime
MLKTICLLVFVGVTAAVLAPEWGRPSRAQEDMAAYQNNSCVNCHSKDATARATFQRYTEWHVSAHKEKGVGCEKCHGGDPAAKDQRRAHVGVVKPSEPQSRVHLKNLPETCNACHPGVVSSFVESLHYQKLKASGMGPSCTTCHAHMATTVLYTPEETAALCAHCHNTINGILPRRPDIPEKANEVMQAIRRANVVVLWADRLLEQGQNKKVDLSAEQQEMKIVRALLAEAKISWHAFNLDVVRKKADEAFEMGTKVKDALRQKLYPQ